MLGIDNTPCLAPLAHEYQTVPSSQSPVSRNRVEQRIGRTLAWEGR